MRFTDTFIRRPVYAIVISALILVLGIRSIGLLPIQQYPTVESAVIQVSTSYTGADPATVTAYITTPLENAIAQANGIDYMTSSSSENNSNIQVNLMLNYNPNEALASVLTQINSVLNQLPTASQLPVVTITVGQSIDSMYIGFYSDYLHSNQINDYVLRSAQPKLQAIHGVQQAQILGNYQFAMRAWLDPKKLAGYGLTTADVAKVLSANDFVAATGRSDGETYVRNFTANTALSDVNGFKNLVVKSTNNAIVRLKDVAKVSMGSQNYNTTIAFNNKPAIYVGIVVAPGANLLSVIKQVKNVYHEIRENLPTGLKSNIVYDSSKFVHASIEEVNATLFEAFLIVTVVVFLFLGSFRSLVIPVLAIPLSIVGTFFIMLLLGYSMNLLTLLALVLAIGLVVDDAIIVVENVHRHIADGVTPFKAAIMSARELTKPIIAISIVLIAVYLPIGFMGGLTGALFTEFAFTLAGAVGVSAVIALTLSPMMCSRMLRPHNPNKKKNIIDYFDYFFTKVTSFYKKMLTHTLKYLPVMIVFAVIVLASNYFLFMSSGSELAPQEDQGVVLAQMQTSANASITQSRTYINQVAKIFHSYPQTLDTFEVTGTSGAIQGPQLNAAFAGMVLVPWDQRQVTTNQLQPILQKQMDEDISGAKIAMFQPPSLPGGGSGLPIQFVIESTDSFAVMNQIAQEIYNKALASGKFLYVDSNLKYDEQQTKVDINRDKVAQFGLTMQDIGNSLSAALSQNYINYFNFKGRSYQVIPQLNRQSRLNTQDLLNYYVKNSQGIPLSLSTFVKLKDETVPQNLNHFQQLNSVTFSAIAAPFVSMGQALDIFKDIAKPILPNGYTINYGAQSRQFMQESDSLLITFILALIIIFLCLALLFNSFRDPCVVLVSVPMSICGAMIFISLGVGGSTLNIYTEVGLITLIGLISKHGILIVEFANDLQKAGKAKLESIIEAATIRFRPIIMTTAAMVLGVVPLIMATGAGAVSRFQIGLVIATGISIGTCFTLFVVPSMYMLMADDLSKKPPEEDLSDLDEL